MNELETELVKFFHNRNQEYSLPYLMDRFDLSFREEQSLIDLLYKLECQGIIYQNSKGMFISTRYPNFRYVCGKLEWSNRHHYYINLQDGKKIMLAKEEIKKKEVHIGEYLYVEPSEGHHSKCLNGTIKRIIKPLDISIQKEFVIEGTLQKNLLKNYYYVLYENIEIPIKEIHGAFLRDKVRVEVTRENKEFTGEVIQTLEQARQERVFIFDNGSWTSFENSQMKAKIIGEPKQYADGTRILATYSYNKEKNVYYIEPIKVIEITSPHMDEDINSLAEEYGFSKNFDESILKEVSLITPATSPFEKRMDLRKMPTFTIDPIYAKDLDDAISIEKLEDGYRLYVHIADVSAYVPFDSETMQEACKRGTSCYLSHHAFPMLPQELSNHLCSLNPGGDKLTKTYEMFIDNTGKIIDKEFKVYDSIIRSNRQFDYDTVNHLLSEGILQKNEIPYAKTLLYMQELSLLLEKKKKDRGALDFDLKEMKFDYGAGGNATHIEEEQRGPANKMIENFMLAANESCAKYAKALDLPFIYRTHAAPTHGALNRLSRILQSFCESTKSVKSFEDPKKMQHYLTSLYNKSSEEERKYWAIIFLQSLPRAKYSSVPDNHYGLGLDVYATNTSPIRRFADLANQTSISEHQRNGRYSESMKRIGDMMESVCDYISERQKIADELERISQYMLLHDYASNFQGEILPATIEFLEEGKALARSYNNIPGTIYLPGSVFERRTRRLIYNNINYYIGDPIQITIAPSKNKMQGIEFQMVQETRKRERRNR